jgi:hypothetical protein
LNLGMNALAGERSRGAGSISAARQVLHPHPYRATALCFCPKCRVPPQIHDSLKYILQAAKQAWHGFSSGFSQVPQSDIELAHVRDARIDDEDEDEDMEEDEGRGGGGRGAHPTSSAADSPPASRRRAEQATRRVEGSSCGWTLLAWLGRGRQVWAQGRGWIPQGYGNARGTCAPCHSFSFALSTYLSTHPTPLFHVVACGTCAACHAYLLPCAGAIWGVWSSSREVYRRGGDRNRRRG